MAIVLSLLAAVCFGAGDFAGGMATKRTRIVEVVAGSHFIGLIGSTIAALFLADRFQMDDLLIGMVAGFAGAVGIWFLYRRLADGPMAIVAPLTAVTSAVVPVTANLIDGATLSWLSWAGITLGLVAILIVSASSSHDDSHGVVTRRVIVESLLAGVGFGSFFVVVDLTDAESAPWPIVGGRILTALVLGALLLSRPDRIRTRDRQTAGFIVIAGLMDAGANVMFLYATIEGDLAVVSVLSSMYPITTVMLAAAVLGERVTRWQLLGVAAALSATVLIASG